MAGPWKKSFHPEKNEKKAFQSITFSTKTFQQWEKMIL